MLLCGSHVGVSVLLLVGSLLTGGLHMDGWADLIDGLSGSYNRRACASSKIHTLAHGWLRKLIVMVKYARLNALACSLLPRPGIDGDTQSLRHVGVLSPTPAPRGWASRSAIRRNIILRRCSAGGTLLCGLRGVHRGTRRPGNAWDDSFYQRLGGITGDVCPE